MIVLGLLGGNEMRPGCEAFDTALLESAGNPAAVHVVPIALARNGSPAMAMRLAGTYFGSLGATAVEVPWLRRGDGNGAAVLAAMAEARLVYLLGGDPGHLLDTLAGSPAWTLLAHRAARGEVVIAGSSAGAMVLCQALLLRSPNPSPSARHARAALGVVPGTVCIPHLNQVEQGWLRAAGREAPGLTVLGLDEMTGVVYDGAWTAWGAGRVKVWPDGGAGARTSRQGEHPVLPTPVLV